MHDNPMIQHPQSSETAEALTRLVSNPDWLVAHPEVVYQAFAGKCPDCLVAAMEPQWSRPRSALLLLLQMEQACVKLGSARLIDQWLQDGHDGHKE